MSNSGPPSQRDRRSLQELAKLASQPSLGPASSKPPQSGMTPAPGRTTSAPGSMRTPTPPPASIKSVNDSGIVDLKQIATVDAGAEERAKTTPLASAGLFEDEEAPSIPPPALSSRPMPLVQKAPSKAPPPPAAKPSLLMPILGGLTLAAVAAAIFVVTHPKPRPAPAPVAVTAPAPVPAPPAPSPTAATKEPPAAAAAVAATDPAPPAEAAPSADAPKVPAQPPGAGAGPSPGRRAPGPASAKKEEGPGGSTVSGLASMMAQATNSAPTAPVASGSLSDAVQHAVGDTANAAAPAAAADNGSGPQLAPGAAPQKPSQGAVTGALGRVLPQARGCLNPDDPISRANVTFTSAGSVSQVVVTGFAAGKPAEDCIKRALTSASVPPFVQATYSANVTIRPN